MFPASQQLHDLTPNPPGQPMPGAPVRQPGRRVLVASGAAMPRPSVRPVHTTRRWVDEDRRTRPRSRGPRILCVSLAQSPDHGSILTYTHLLPPLSARVLVSASAHGGQAVRTGTHDGSWPTSRAGRHLSQNLIGELEVSRGSCLARPSCQPGSRRRGEVSTLAGPTSVRAF